MSVEKVCVEVSPQPYEVMIGSGLLKGVGLLVKRAIDAKRVALVTDSTVAEVCGEDVDSELARAGLQSFGFTVPAGEQAKTWDTAGALLEGLAEVGIDRSDAVVALGGGVVGDLAGFTAAVYQRGIDVVQIPTTLLAMVDASVGGKTAVDLRAGKNLAGAFKQPRLVVMDINVLKSLPEAEWRSGLAEIAKSGVISGEEFLSWLEQNADALLNRDPEVVAEAVRRSVAFKAAVVSGDEFEEGPREGLNYGHTFGHAIERAAGYGRIPHGLAVAEGMRFAARVSEDMGRADASFVARQDALLDALGLEVLEGDLSSTELFKAMRMDKKSRAGSIRFVLVDGPGAWSCEAVPDEVIVGFVDAWGESKRPAPVSEPTQGEEA